MAMMIEALRKVFRRLHHPTEVTLVCARCYAVHPLSPARHREMMAMRGVFVNHATLHHLSIRKMPILAAVFRRRKRPVGTSWRMGETCINLAVS